MQRFPIDGERSASAFVLFRFATPVTPATNQNPLWMTGKFLFNTGVVKGIKKRAL